MWAIPPLGTARNASRLPNYACSTCVSSLHLGCNPLSRGGIIFDVFTIKHLINLTKGLTLNQQVPGSSTLVRPQILNTSGLDVWRTSSLRNTVTSPQASHRFLIVRWSGRRSGGHSRLTSSSPHRQRMIVSIILHIANSSPSGRYRPPMRKMGDLTEGVHSCAAIFSALFMAGARVSIDDDESLSRNSPSRLWIESLASSGPVSRMSLCWKSVRTRVIPAF